MTVKELKEFLEEIPDTYSVLYLDKYGDPLFLAEQEIEVNSRDTEIVIGVGFV